jgi:hypothetical protein
MEDVGAIVLVPRLMRPEWFRRFVRTVDVYFYLPVNSPYWPLGMHEPLLVGIAFPLLRHDPWQWRKVPFMVGLGRALSALHSADHISGRNLLRKFWAAWKRAIVMPPSVVCKLLHHPSYHPFLSLSSQRRRRNRDDPGG